MRDIDGVANEGKRPRWRRLCSYRLVCTRETPMELNVTSKLLLQGRWASALLLARESSLIIAPICIFRFSLLFRRQGDD